MRYTQEVLGSDPLKHLSPYQRYLARGSKRIVVYKGDRIVLKEVLAIYTV